MSFLLQGRIRFGLVGCGRISKNHCEAIAAHPDAELKAVCDIDPERLKACADRWRAMPYTDLGKMLERDDLDVVSVCTPSGLHPEHGILIARSGRHVICEKPLGISLESVDRLISACTSSDVRLFTVLQNRLNSTMQFLKRSIEKGRFGRLYMAQANVFWSRPQSYYDQAKWRGTWEFDGCAFMNQASHYVDSLQWLVGPVDSVMAITGTLARKIETEEDRKSVV